MQYVNDVDPITLESIEDIPPDNRIELLVGDKLRFYNVNALYEWVNIKPVDPTTKIPFTSPQLNKITNIHSKSTHQRSSADIEKLVEDFLKRNPNPMYDLFDLKLSNTVKEKIYEQIDSMSLNTIIKNNDIKQHVANAMSNMLGTTSEETSTIINDIFDAIQSNPSYWENITKDLLKSM